MQGNLYIKNIYSWLLYIKNKKIKSYVIIMYFLRQFASINKKNNLIVQRLNVNSKSNDLNVERLGILFSKKLNTKNFSNFNNKNLNPWFVTGFCDGESSFSVSIYKNKKLNTGWGVNAIFQIELHVRDLELIKQFQEFFHCGIIVLNKTRQKASFRVNSLQDLINKIIPHFLHYPLLTQKAADFILFKKVVELMNEKVHLTENGLQQIINIRASMNLGLSDLQKVKFHNYNPVERPIINTTKILDPQWIAGFTSAEGSFLVSIFKSKTNLGHAVRLYFSITQHERDLKLLNLIAQYLENPDQLVTDASKSNIYKNYKYSAFEIRLTQFENIKKIILFFKNHPILGMKSLDFQDFCKIVDLMKEDKHLTVDGLNEIRIIKSKMNRNRNQKNKPINSENDFNKSNDDLDKFP